MQTKNEYAEEDAITDDTAGQAYIEQFAQETLDRAERVVKADKVTQQTAMTFDAAATFFHLVNIWGPPDQETQQKIKYAKWNAARIAKAIKEGKDPNESNPKPEVAPQQPALDVTDAELQGFGTTTPAPLPPNPQHATDQDGPDQDVSTEAAGVSLPHSPASAMPSEELELPGVPTHLSDPQPPAQQPGYFDSHSMPSPVSPPSHDPVGYQPPADTSAPPRSWAATPPPPQAPNPAFSPPSPTTAPEDHYRSAPSPPAAPPTFAPDQSPTPAVAPAPVAQPAVNLAKPTVPLPSTTTMPASAPVSGVDEAAMVQAQKHAKWAISALNFEDVNTAVVELRRALQSLGAS